MTQQEIIRQSKAAWEKAFNRSADRSEINSYREDIDVHFIHHFGTDEFGREGVYIGMTYYSPEKMDHEKGTTCIKTVYG